MWYIHPNTNTNIRYTYMNMCTYAEHVSKRGTVRRDFGRKKRMIRSRYVTSV
jgi:hypothetical protein